MRWAFPSSVLSRARVASIKSESTWRISPQNFVNAQQLAQVRDAAGENEGRDEILLAAAVQSNAPPWFIWEGQSHGIKLVAMVSL